MKIKKYIILGFCIFTFFMITGCINKQKIYNVTFIAISDDPTSTITIQVKANEKIPVKESPNRPEYKFIGWYYNGELFDFNTPITKDITLIGKWDNANVYKVSFITNTSIQLADKYIQENETIGSDYNPPIGIKGYEFLGWYLNGEYFNLDTPITSSITLEAKWKLIDFKITYELNGGHNSINNPTSFTVEDLNIVLNEPYKNGYIFKGWYNNSNFDGNKVTEIANREDTTLYAKWEPKEYTVIFDTNCDKKIEPVKIKHGEVLSKPIDLVLENHEFLGWYSLDNLYDFSKPVTSNLKLIAMWEMTKDGVKEYLDSLIPETVTSNLMIFSYINNCSAEFIWSSSNTDVITDTGAVTRFTVDKIVTLSVIVLYSDYQYELEFDVKVPKIELKPLIKGQIVSGYLADYGSFTGLSDKMVEQLDYINYSFATISNGEVKISASQKVNNVLAYRDKGVRVGLAIGGWGADGFSQAVRTIETRTKFIDSIMNIIKEYQFDGIDIDWEYPGSGVAGIEYHKSDRENLTLFCKELKQRMLEYRSDLILSIAIAPSNTYYDLAALNQYIDIFNVMTYDFAMGNVAKHDSNLYSTSLCSSSMNNSVNFVKKYVDSDKIIPGAAFYVRRGMFANSNQALGANLSTSMGTSPLTYANFMNMLNNNNEIIESYDKTAEAAYTIYNGWFYSYDNPISIKAKCDYIKNNNLGGLMCWDLTNDYVDENGVGVLTNSMYVGLK